MSNSRLLIDVNNITLNVTQVDGIEQLNQGFEFILIGESSQQILLEHLLFQSALITFVNKDNFFRHLAGIIFESDNLGTFKGKYRYKIVIKDRLSTLKNITNSKVFIGVNLKDVIFYLAGQAGYSPGQIDFRVGSSLPALPQCVQAMETNWHFLQRILTQFGLFIWFETKNNIELLVISDSNLNSPYLQRGVVSVKNSAGMNNDENTAYVGFFNSQVHHSIYNDRTDCVAHGQYLKVASNSQSYFEPCASTPSAASLQAQDFSNALASLNKTTQLVGNVCDLFAGSSVAIDDQTGTGSSADLLCVSVYHSSEQPNDENSHQGLTRYSCKAQFIERGTPFKAKPLPHQPKPMVFPAKVESLTTSSFIDDLGCYRVRTDFDTTARPIAQSSQAIQQLALYACQNQPQATGWHFPLVGGSEVLIGCINNDPNNTFLMGFAMNESQPSVVTAANNTQNRLVSAAQNELQFDDDKQAPKIILQTLASEHYLELNAKKSGRQFIEWISQLGTINLHAGKDLCLTTENDNIQFVIKNNQFIDVKNNVSLSTQNRDINMQSAGSQAWQGKNTLIESRQALSMVSGRAVKAFAQSDIQLKTSSSDLTISAPNGSTFLQTNQSIAITGSGRGDLILHNEGGEIKLDSQGNVEIIATDVLTLDGTFINFDGPVDYDIESPSTARAQSLNVSRAPAISSFDLADSSIASSETVEYSFSSELAKEQIYLLAEQIAELPFVTAMAATFGTDIPTSVYQDFYKIVSDRQLPNVEIHVHPSLIFGHLAAFNNVDNRILLTNPLIEKALLNNEGKALLLSALLEEFGHALDYYLRNVLSNTGGDAKQDEGAIFAYQLLDLELFKSSSIELGTLTTPNSSEPLIYNNDEVAQLLNNVNEKHQSQDDIVNQLEFFGAGTGDDSNPASYGHRSIEFVLEQVDFDAKLDLPIIYFGNWMRDFSQFVDPAIVRPSKDALKRLQSQGHLKPELDTIRLSRSALTELVAILALKEFSRFGEDIGRFCYHYVTPKTLGVYRAEEHIDNPKSEKNGQFDNSTIDADFAKPYIESQVAINPLSGLKNYINTPIAGQSFNTAVQYMTAQLELAMNYGDSDKGKIHFGQALHVLEDYFSHSNFIEVSIIKLGKENCFATPELNRLAAKVYPVVDIPANSPRIPIVTGRFGQTDVLASIGPKLANLFKDSIEEFKAAEPGVRTPADIAIKVILSDLATSQTADTTKDNTKYQGLDFVDLLAKYEQFLSWRDELNRKKDEYIPRLLLKILHYSAELFVLVSSFAIHHIIETVAHKIDDAQTLISKTGTDPTHSQLAKDHDVHPFHEIAALVARDAVAIAGKEMKRYWQGDHTKNPAKIIANIIKHPDFQPLFEKRIVAWANKNVTKVKKGTYKTSLEEAHEHLNKQADNLKNKIDQAQSSFTNVFREIYDYFN